jgi:glycosyltransferase involved in cell wall biosynthesis
VQRKLAIFLPGLYEGGAERVMLNLAVGLAGRGHAVDLVLAQSEGPYLAQVPQSVRLVELNRRHVSFLRVLVSLPALVLYLRRERPDALLSGLNANIIAVWAGFLSGKPQRIVICEHCTFSQQNRELPVWYGRVMHQLVRRFYPWASEIIAVSEGVADDLSQVSAIPRSRIRVIYNPVITPEIQAKAREPVEHPWFVPGGPPVVLGIGRLTAAKDFSTLIRAFAQVRRSLAARLLILGEGEKRTELESLVRALDLEEDVCLSGFVSNPYSYLAKASLFVLSSRWEGLPTVLVEALYCGTPVISTNCPSGPREILREGRHGLLVPVGDVDSMAQAMRAALSGATRLPSERCWEPYQLESIVSQYENILLGT